jgi:hypothetical protein
MPREANESLFDSIPTQIKTSTFEPSAGRVKLEPVDWHDNVTEGVKQMIHEGDHMASLLRRVLAGELCPRTTIHNAIDRWENTAVGFEKPHGD